MATTVELEGAERLEVVIKNTKPIVLTDLTLALLAVGQQYEAFVEHELPPELQVASTLLVKEVRTGSIIFELIRDTVIPSLPLFWSNGSSLVEWCRLAEHLMQYLTGKIVLPPRTMTKNDLKQWSNIVEPIAKDSGSQMNFVVSEGGTVINQFIMNSTDANVMQNRIRKEIGAIEEPTDTLHRKRVMTWYQARFDPVSQIGNKALIESISNRPLRVVFDNNAIKDAMFSQGTQFNMPWQELAYLVDVQVQTIEGRPTVATIMKFYPELTFNPAE